MSFVGYGDERRIFSGALHSPQSDDKGETRDQRPETRDQRPESRDQRSEIRDWGFLREKEEAEEFLTTDCTDGTDEEDWIVEGKKRES